MEEPVEFCMNFSHMDLLPFRVKGKRMANDSRNVPDNNERCVESCSQGVFRSRSSEWSEG